MTMRRQKNPKKEKKITTGRLPEPTTTIDGEELAP
jgi:hypothetical protein